MAKRAISNGTRKRKAENEAYQREIDEILAIYHPQADTMVYLNTIRPLRRRLAVLKMAYGYGLKKLSAELERSKKDVQ